MREEYSLFVVKPDGVRIGIFNEFKEMCTQKGIEIVDQRYTTIDRSKVEYLFNVTCRGDIYNDYISNGNVIVGLCKGKAVFERILEIKHDIRNKYNVLGKMMNLIHTAEDGMEYLREFEFFFKEKNIRQYSLGSDLCIRGGNLDSSIEDIVNNTNLTNIGININNVTQYNIVDYSNLNLIYYADKRLKIDGECVSTLAYSRDIELLNMVNNIKGCLTNEVLNYKDFFWVVDCLNLIYSSDLKSRIRKFADAGIGGLLAYQSGIEYNTLNLLKEWGGENKLKLIGGSCNERLTGKLSFALNQEMKMILFGESEKIK